MEDNYMQSGYSFIFKTGNDDFDSEYNDIIWDNLLSIDSIPIVGDIINLKNIVDDNGLQNIKNVIGTHKFIVKERELKYFPCFPYKDDPNTKRYYQTYNITIIPKFRKKEV